MFNNLKARALPLVLLVAAIASWTAPGFAAISTKLLFAEQIKLVSGSYLSRSTFVVTGLTASAANTVAHGLPRAPRRVFFTPVGNAALGVLASLDTSQGNADPTGLLAGGKLGFDATNLYIFMGAGTQVIVTVEY